MAHEQDGPGIRAHGFDLREQVNERTFRGEVIGQPKLLLQFQTARHDFGRLPGAHERAGKNHVEDDLHLAKLIRKLPRAPDALGRERARGIGRVARIAGLRRFTMTKKEKFHFSVRFGLTEANHGNEMEMKTARRSAALCRTRERSFLLVLILVVENPRIENKNENEDQGLQREFNLGKRRAVVLIVSCLANNGARS